MWILAVAAMIWAIVSMPLAVGCGRAIAVGRGPQLRAEPRGPGALDIYSTV